MYQKPDFVKVSLKVSDVFASYLTTGCPEKEVGMWMNTVPCDTADDRYFEGYTMTSAGYAHMCYADNLP